MANTSSAKKALRASRKKAVFNKRRKESMNKATKAVKDSIAKEKGGEGAKKLLPEAYKAIDKAAKRGLIKKNTASRKKSRITKMVNKTAK